MPCEVGQVGKLAGGRTARVDDEHIQVPQKVLRLAHERIGGARYRQVADQPLDPELRGGRGHTSRVARADCDSRALPGKDFGDGLAESA